MNAIPPDLARSLTDIGRVIDPEATGALYAPLHGRAPFADVRIERDVKYGPAERNRLDVFTTQPAGSEARPVFIFLHGGGFVAGDKNLPDSPFHDNVGVWAARNGLVGVNMTHRLAPQATWPAGAEDVAAAVRWVRDNIAAYGGDPTRIFLMGHSAGAVHVATYVAHARFHPAEGHGLAGLIISSGIYDFSTSTEAGTYTSYFGTDRARYAERSPRPALDKVDLPILLIDAELDPPRFLEQAEALAVALRKAGNAPQVLRLAGHGHISGNYSIGTLDTTLSKPLLDFVRGAS